MIKGQLGVGGKNPSYESPYKLKNFTTTWIKKKLEKKQNYLLKILL